MSALLVVRRIPLLVFAAGVALVVIACGNDAVVSTPTAEVGRVNIREGRFLRGTDLGEANFSAVLPPGWTSVDAPEVILPGRPSTPTGIIAKFGEPSPVIEWSITASGTNTLDLVREGERVEERDIDGIRVAWLVPSSLDDLQSQPHTPRVLAAYPSLPGDESAQFGLRINATGIQSVGQYREVESLIRSLRYATPPPEFTPPEVAVTPGAEWRRVSARAVFSVLAPPDWTFAPRQGLDTFPGLFTNGDLTILFDFGTLAMGAPRPDVHIRYPADYPELEFWSETVNGRPFVLFRPMEDLDNFYAYTGVSVDIVPGLPDDTVLPDVTRSISGLCGGTLFAQYAGPEDQELILAILRTLRAGAGAHCN